MNPITVFLLASLTIGLWDFWLIGIEAGAGPLDEKNETGSISLKILPNPTLSDCTPLTNDIEMLCPLFR